MSLVVVAYWIELPKHCLGSEGHGGATYADPVNIRIPIIEMDGPLPERDGVRIPRKRVHERPDIQLHATVMLLGADGEQRQGEVTHIGDKGVEVTYTD